MVKNKGLPDSATPPVWSLSLSLSPSQTWPYQGWSHVSSLCLADAVHPDGAPWILPRLDPGTPEPPLLTLGEQMSSSEQKAQPLWVLLSTIFLFGLCLTSSSLSSEQFCSGLAADLDRTQAGSQSIRGSSCCQKPFKESPARSSPGWRNACPERSQWRR